MSPTITMTIGRSRSLDIFRDKDDCSICDQSPVIDTCDKCGDGVCKHPNCQWSFPYKDNKDLILCKCCYNKIDSKLLNYDHVIIYKFIKKHTFKRRRISC